MQQLVNGIKRVIRGVMREVALLLNEITLGRVTPNSVTWFGLFMHLPIAFLIANGELVRAAILLLVFGLFDTLDGELARVQKRETNHGGFLDASTDRFKEVLLYTGVAWLLARGDHPEYAAIAVAACGASICVSFVKAKGEAVVSSLDRKIPYTELNRMFSGGFFPFEIRMLVLLVGLFADQLIWAVSIIALFSAVTALQRLVIISRSLR
jgi:CDP-diacylglycerol---glycerol-3-phosphate 3-phosphatidyltransferase